MRLANGLLALTVALVALAGAAPALAQPCDKPVYLTFDTGHMGVAPLVAEVLKRHAVKVTFFLANEATLTGGASLDDSWAAWWRERAAEGHAFGSHTWDHDVWRADVGSAHGQAQGQAQGQTQRFKLRPTAGEAKGRDRVLDAAAYCHELRRPAERLATMTGQRMGSVFRAPGGKTSPALLAAAQSCGYAHVGWSAAGFLGDELPSEKYSNESLLQRALREVKTGDILLAHLGIWSRRDPWAPAVLEPLIVGLKQRGLCFATLREHPTLGAAASRLR